MHMWLNGCGRQFICFVCFFFCSTSADIFIHMNVGCCGDTIRVQCYIICFGAKRVARVYRVFFFEPPMNMRQVASSAKAKTPWFIGLTMGIYVGIRRLCIARFVGDCYWLKCVRKPNMYIYIFLITRKDNIVWLCVLFVLSVVARKTHSMRSYQSSNVFPFDFFFVLSFVHCFVGYEKKNGCRSDGDFALILYPFCLSFVTENNIRVQHYCPAVRVLILSFRLKLIALSPFLFFSIHLEIRFVHLVL